MAGTSYRFFAGRVHRQDTIGGNWTALTQVESNELLSTLCKQAEAGQIQHNAKAKAAPDYFGGLVEQARATAAKASVKFPQPNYVTLKIAEEAGEVVRGAVHYAEGRMDWSEVEGEIVQLLAMLIRFVTEGDQVNGIHLPGTTRDLIEGGLLRGDEPCECGETNVEECDDCCDLMVGHRSAKVLPEGHANG